jgi:hypothetical protein
LKGSYEEGTKKLMQKSSKEGSELMDNLKGQYSCSLLLPMAYFSSLKMEAACS